MQGGDGVMGTLVALWPHKFDDCDYREDKYLHQHHGH